MKHESFKLSSQQKEGSPLLVINITIPDFLLKISTNFLISHPLKSNDFETKEQGKRVSHGGVKELSGQSEDLVTESLNSLLV